jgi:hypothetical protein
VILSKPFLDSVSPPGADRRDPVYPERPLLQAALAKHGVVGLLEHRVRQERVLQRVEERLRVLATISGLEPPDDEPVVDLTIGGVMVVREGPSELTAYVSAPFRW